MSYSKILLIDGHVHIYPYYNVSRAIKNGINNLQLAFKKSAGLSYRERDNGYILIWLLTERSDCNFFKQVIDAPHKFGNDNIKFLPGDENEAILVEIEGKPMLYILAGRQIVTKEGLEILSLASTYYQKDKEKSIGEVINSIVNSGGIAALNWAPGKWFFSRGKVIKRVIEEYAPENLVICDTSLRNTLWPMPKLMIAAQKRGFKIIAGSDPLPFNSEEKYIGSYGFYLTGDFDINYPAKSLQLLLKQAQVNISFFGKRNNVFTFCKRQYKIMMA